MNGNRRSSAPGGPGRSGVSRRAKWGVAAALLLIIVAVASGSDSKKHGQPVGSGAHSPAVSTPAAVAPVPVAQTARSRSTHKHTKHKAVRKTRTIRLRPSVCPSATRVLAGVYHSDRLRVISPCRHVSGMVISTRSEEDGDLHFDVRLDSPYRRMLVANNYSEQGGALVVEFMPRDHGHLPAPSVGDRVSITGAYVDDMDHAWSEIHPVWALAINGGHLYRSGPQYGGSPDSARSYDAASTCRTDAGALCTSYGGTTASNSGEPTTASRSTPAPPSSGGGCTPGYSPCIPPGPDVDCAGGSGNGPRYVQGPVYVTGSDPYHLDANGDGVACT